MEKSTIEAHPLANIFPMLPPAEIRRLAADIADNDLQNAITLFDGKIIDGRNRYAACVMAGVEPHFDTLPDGVDPLKFVLSQNLHRRHLDASQRSMVAAKLATLERGSNQHAPIGAPSRDQAADMLNVSPKSVERAKAVLRDGDADTIAAIEGGKLKVGRAHGAIRKEKERETIAKIVESGIDGKIIVGDFRNVNIASGSVDAIVTDPPYPNEFIPLFRDLGAFAARVLKSGGSLICLCGQSYLPDYFSLLAESLTYHWTIGIHLPGGQAVQIHNRQVITFWKPALWFTNGKRNGEWCSDFIRTDTNNNDKHHHHWGQSEQLMRGLVERASGPGDLIVDPFFGGGTTGSACANLGRKFIGIEIDTSSADESGKRLGIVPCKSTTNTE